MIDPHEAIRTIEADQALPLNAEIDNAFAPGSATGPPKTAPVTPFMRVTLADLPFAPFLLPAPDNTHNRLPSAVICWAFGMLTSHRE